MRAGGHPLDALPATLRHDILEYIHPDNNFELVK
jgi:hypothetical protein